MQKGILGKKIGMTQVFDAEGRVVPVTVVEAGPCVVIQKKTNESDGYEAIQVGFAAIKDKHVNRPRKGHFSRHGVQPRRYVREFRLADTSGFEVGAEITVTVFNEGDLVDVTGTSKGKGFAGSIKRWGFHRGPMTHGSKYHRGPGSFAARMSGGGGKVPKGRKMPGRMGGERVTVQGLRVVRIDPERNLILIKGAIPGTRGALVSIRDSVKARSR